MRRLVLLAIIAQSLALRGQTPLVMYGIGLLQPPGDVLGQGAANISSLPLGPEQALSTNVASWYALPRTQLRATIGSRSIRRDDGTGTFKAGLQHLQFLLHLDNRTALGIGLNPVTRIDLGLEDTSGMLLLIPDTIRYGQSRDIKGGVSGLQLGFSRNLGGSTSIGLSIEYMFGTLSVLDTLSFTNLGSRTDLLSWSGLLVPLLGSERRMTFAGRTAGISIQTGAIPRGRSQIGLQGEWPISLGANMSTRYQGSTPHTEEEVKNLKLPARLSAGYALDFTERLRIIAELTEELHDTTGNNPLLFGRQFGRIRSLRMALARTPAGADSPQPGLISYRVGIILKQYYLPDLKENPLNEIGFTLGLGVASPRFGYQINLALQVGQRDVLPGLQKETFFRLSIGATTGELWFARPKKNWN